MDNIISEKQKRRLPWIMATAVFIQMLDATILNTALPSIAKSLNISPLNMQMTVIVYALTLALIMPLNGQLADRFGTKKVFLFAIILFGIGSLLCATATSLNLLILYRIIQGIGGAMLPVARLALIKSFPRSEWLNTISFAIMPALLGPIIGPLLGGYLSSFASWHWIFLINIPIVLIGIWLCVRDFPDFTGENIKIDWTGYILFALSAFLLTLGLDYADKVGGLLFLSLMLLGVLFMFAYVVYANHSTNAIFSLELLKIRTFRIGLIGNLFCRIGISSIPFLLPLLLQVAFACSPEFSGWLLAPMALASMLAKPAITPLISYFGYRKILVGNTILLGLCIIAFAIDATKSNLIYFLPILLLMGFLNSIQFSSMNTISLSDLEYHQNSSGNSLLSVNQQLALSFGLAVGSSLLRWTNNQEWLTHNSVYMSFKITFIILGIITILSSCVFMFLRQRDGDNLIKLQ